MFTQKHYIAIAKTLKEVNAVADEAQMIEWYDLIEAFLDLFEGDNAKFDKVKFIKACKTEEKINESKRAN